MFWFLLFLFCMKYVWVFLLLKEFHVSQSFKCSITLDTEIDWIAYMQQVETFINGTLDYDKLIGQTGPCV